MILSMTDLSESQNGIAPNRNNLGVISEDGLTNENFNSVPQSIPPSNPHQQSANPSLTEPSPARKSAAFALSAIFSDSHNGNRLKENR